VSARLRDGDPAALFAALPMPALLLGTDLVVRDVTTQLLVGTCRTREDVVGRHVLEAFARSTLGPLHADVGPDVAASLERVLRTGRPDRLPTLRWDLPAGQGGDLRPRQERWWSILTTPVRGSDGQVQQLLCTAQDVTPVRVARRERERAEEAGRRLRGLADVALELAGAETVEELTDLVVGRGVAAMGCDGGGVAVRDDVEGIVRLTITGSGRDGRLFQTMSLDEHLPSVVAAVVAEPIYLGDRASGLAWGPEMARVHETSGREAWASLPLVAGGSLLGSLTVSWRRPRQFPESERSLLSAFAAQCAQALQRLQVREAERAAMASSRLLSETLQRSLLTDPPQPDHLELAVRYVPAAQEAYVGGDWYDAFALPEGDTLLVIGDVAGHDRVAAAAMAQVRNLLRGVAYTLEGAPAEVLAGLDRSMEGLGIDVFASAVLAVVAPAERGEGRAVRWSNAGHLPPVLVLPDGDARLLTSAPDVLLGLGEAARADHALTLPPGAAIVVYTDGLIERRGVSLVDSMEWLAGTLRGHGGLTAEQLCDRVIGRLDDAVEDDVAMLVLRVASAP
jgi:serine phosphatase RsbU (regulator of sigma subunit)